MFRGHKRKQLLVENPPQGNFRHTTARLAPRTHARQSTLPASVADHDVRLFVVCLLKFRVVILMKMAAVVGKCEVRLAYGDGGT